MTDKPTPTDTELKAMWQLHAADIGGIFHYARAVLAKWGQPAQAAEPVAVVVPCYTPSGKRVALYSAKQDLPIGTKLYAAPQPPTAPATQQGAADGFFLLLPQRPKPEAPAGTVGLDWDAYSGAQMLTFGRDCSDAAIAALRTEQPAPSWATEEVENLRKALVYAAFALHDTPQYMLAQGITLIDGDTVRVSRDGWTVEASVNPHRQPAPATQQAGEAADSVTAPAPPPECETEAEKRAFAFGWFKALESERMKADNKKKDPL